MNVLTGNKQKVPIKMWDEHVVIEGAAINQMRNVAQIPFVYKHIAVMPDGHAGVGAVIGSVIPMDGAVIPAAVGVDIGCGMTAVKTNLKRSDLPEKLKPIRTQIERDVLPNLSKKNMGGRWANGNIPTAVINAWRGSLEDDFNRLFVNDYSVINGATFDQLGTLGSGNHFVELSYDENDDVWIMLHSGSRGVGNRIGVHYTRMAKEEANNEKIELPDKNLAYFTAGTPNYIAYIHAVDWAQRFAKINRKIMMENTTAAIIKATGKKIEYTSEIIDCHHNYADMENHFGKEVLVIRKGAIRACKGDMGIIPGSMGAKSYIVEGKGNPESFHSCSHGAGRLMSRTQAKNTFSLDDHIKAVEGVECRKDNDVLDETPGAYKSIEDVMASQEDLVEIKHELKQVLSVKG